MATQIDLGDLGITLNTNAAGDVVSATLTLPDGSSFVRPFPGNGVLTMALGLGLGLGFSSGASNQAPTDIAWAGTRTVAEDAALGTQVGGTVSFTDPDALATATFTLTDDAGGRFAIVELSSTSAKVIVAGVLDFEAAGSHAITIRVTDQGGLTYDEAFTVTVTDVSESVPDDPPPDDDPVVDDPDHFDVQPYTVVADGSVKFAGKKKANGLTAKFMHDFSADAGALAANTAHVVELTADFSLMGAGGDLALLGFMLKASNDFYSIGPRGDGAGGLRAYQISGSGKWNATSGFTQSDGGALDNGTQWGPLFLRLTIAADGASVTLASGASFTDWDNEIVAAALGPFANVSGVTQWGLGGVFDANDAGAYALDVASYRIFPAPTFSSTNTAGVAENATLSKTVTSDQSTTKAITGGADAAKLELVGGTSAATSHTLRFAANATKNFEAPDDADANNTYVVTVAATNPISGLTADQTITVTVTDVAEFTSFDGTATDVTLSNANLTVTHANTNSNAGARSAALRNSGKYYFEVTVTDWDGSFDCLGIMTAAATFTNLVSNGTNCSVVYRSSGQIWSNNANTTRTFGTLGDGALIGVAVDLDNEKVWFRLGAAGNWNTLAIGSENPATNTGGVSISNYSGTTMAPAVGFGGAGTQTGDNVTANFGGSAFTGAVPSGFTAGWPIL